MWAWILRMKGNRNGLDFARKAGLLSQADGLILRIFFFVIVYFINPKTWSLI
jgi:hypothetical protein